MTIQRWAYDGVVLSTGDRDEVSLADLKEFVDLAELLGETAAIRVYPYGLRANRVAGEGGPHLDWRD